MKCEVIREGQPCSNAADVIVRTPWTTQLACLDCATSFKRYETQKLEFFCDWPMGGKECGERATHYVEVRDFPKTYHRPLCHEHARRCLTSNIIDDAFDPKLVPHKPPAQPQARVVVSGDKIGLWCHCGKEARYRGGAETMPLCDEHAPQTPTTLKAESPPEEPQHWERGRMLDASFLAPPVVQAVDQSLTDDDIQARLKELVLLATQILKEKLQKWRTR